MQRRALHSSEGGGRYCFKDWKQIWFIKFKGKYQNKKVRFQMVATAPEHFNHLKCPFETFLVFCGMKRTARVPSFKPPSSSGHVPYVTSFHSHFPFPSTPSPVTSHYNTSPHSTRPSRFLPFHLLSPVTPIHHLIPLALVSFHSVSCHQSLQ